MKVEISKLSKNVITIAEMPAAKQIIASLSSDNCSAKNSSEVALAARIVSGESGSQILEARAEIAKNGRIFNYYSDESGTLDVWVEFTAYNDYCRSFYKVGAYVTDIWSADGENDDEIKSHMYVEKYDRV